MDEKKTVEAWKVEKKTPDWLFNGAKAGNHWAIGAELSEADYDEAIDKAAHTSIR